VPLREILSLQEAEEGEEYFEAVLAGTKSRSSTALCDPVHVELRGAKAGDTDAHWDHKPVSTSNVLVPRIYLSGLSSQLVCGLEDKGGKREAGTGRTSQAKSRVTRGGIGWRLLPSAATGWRSGKR
jgi:hypothetical protein